MIENQDVLLVMVPGMAMSETDRHFQALVADVHRRHWRVAVATVDPGPDAYLDGSLEARMDDRIEQVRRAAGASRVWLAGISLGCQAILRCIRLRPDAAEGLILLTPYLASTGLIAEAERAGGLRNWALSNASHDAPDRAFLTWIGTTRVFETTRILMGYALADRFAAAAVLLADLLPADRVVSVAGEHDWASWSQLWKLALDRDPFGQTGP